LLDAHCSVVNSSLPLCLLWTDDIQQALAWMRELNVDVLSEIADVGCVLTLTFRDPDGNLLMLGQWVALGREVVYLIVNEPYDEKDIACNRLIRRVWSGATCRA
jgi:hypothetical protein